MKNKEKILNPPRDPILLEKMLDYEEHFFKDMTWNSKELQNLFMCFYEDDKGKWVKGSFGEIPFISLGYWNIKKKRLRNCDGMCIGKDLEIVIKSGETEKEQKLTMLHEMIHAYIDELTWGEDSTSVIIRETLLLFLYKKLVKRLGYKKTDALIRTGTSTTFWYGKRETASHPVLFVLKSLDLDIRLHLPYGSIFCLW